VKCRLVNQSLYVMALRVRTKYISFVHVLVLIIFGNFDHFAFWPKLNLNLVWQTDTEKVEFTKLSSPN